MWLVYEINYDKLGLNKGEKHTKLNWFKISNSIVILLQTSEALKSLLERKRGPGNGLWDS